MHNILDYLYWRSDLTFEQDPLNEIDALIFSEFSYIDFNLLALDALKEGVLTIKRAAELWKEADRTLFMPSGYLLHEQAYEALTLAGDSERFSEIVIAKDIKEISLEDESQFGATCFYKDDQPFFIAFQGTDLRSLSWKEDLQMSYLPEIPSQGKAVDFLNAHFAEYPKSITIGGHSKGGNLAVYAAIYLDEEYRDLLQRIYSFDGPGFLKPVLAEINYQAIKNKIKSYVPQDSMIGHLLYKLEDQIIIYSNGSDAKQHDVFTWEIKGNTLIPSKASKSSRKIAEILEDTLAELSVDDRKNFTEALFTIIGDGEEDYIVGDRQFNLEQIPRVIKEFVNLSQDEKIILVRVLRLFYRKRLEIL